MARALLILLVLGCAWEIALLVGPFPWWQVVWQAGNLAACAIFYRVAVRETRDE